LPWPLSLSPIAVALALALALALAIVTAIDTAISANMHFSVRTLAAVAAFAAITFLYIVNSASARDPTSVFFNPRKGYAARYSAIRREQAEAYLHSYHTAGHSNVVKAGNERQRKLCVGIPSFKREGVHYLRDTIGSLLEGLTPEERQELYIMVFIPHSNPSTHPEFNEEWLPDLVDHVLTYEFGDDSMQYIRNMEAGGGLFIEKALFDYSYLLKKCADMYTPYIAMIEDDTVAMDGWYARTIAGIHEAEQQAALKRAEPDFLYLRLFYTEQFLGWNAEDWRTYLYYSLWVAAIPTALLLFIRLARPTTKLSLSLTTNRSILVIYGCVGAVILLFFGLGRMTVLPVPAGVHEMPEFGCCGQAFVFPNLKALELVDYFKERRRGITDVLIEDFANEHGELRYALSPSVVQHIGRVSTTTPDYGPMSKWGMSVAETIWSFAFENFDWRQLRKEHEQVALRRKEVKMETEAAGS
jgi:hypothetical protein